MNVTIYTVAYNEELMLPFFINHYRKQFPNCHIVVYDNQSTDRTVEIARESNCEIIQYDTNNTISDSKYLEIKNNCWKSSTTDWNFVCDVDELCQINIENLIHESNVGTSIIRFVGYDMVNTSEDPSNITIEGLCNGVRNWYYDKSVAFNKSKISEINFEPGCHTSFPSGDIQYSENHYNLFHYKFIGEDYVISRYKLFSSRLSTENLHAGWGSHYKQAEENLRSTFKTAKENSIKLI